MNRCLRATAALFGLSAVAAAQIELQPRLGEPVHGLTPAQRADFQAALAVFNTPLDVVDGLGPAFNDRSCGNCHAAPAPGGSSVRTVTRFGRAASGPNPFDPLPTLGGSLLQEQANSASCEETVPAQADVTTERSTPIVYGAGLVELVDDADVLLLEMNQPPGFAGFAHMVNPVENPGTPRVGRFGWKGTVATVTSFSADASVNEIGLTSVFFPMEEAPNGDATLLATCDTVADPEDLPGPGGMTKIDSFDLFQRFLAAPAQTPKSGMSGETIFENVGCGVCHVTAGFVTGPSSVPALSGVQLKPYTDFLVHDMGALGDGIVQGAAQETDFLTRALWGLQARGAFLHDAASTGGSLEDNLRDAIARHAGEGQASRDAFLALPMTDQDLVLAFLGSLGRIEFDWERDNDVDVFDWFFVEPFFTGPVPSLTPDDAGALCDVEQDGDFDLVDFGLLQRGFTGNL